MFEFLFNERYYSGDFKLIQNLKEKWDELHLKPNVFRYKLDNLQEKVTDDGYVLVLNQDRNSKRRQPEQIINIRQSFDESKFNFTKISNDEVLMKFWSKHEDTDKHLVLVNVSPINRYHSLLCPFSNQKLPQVVTLKSLQLVLDLFNTAQDRALRVAFNSLCALASVNHLHYHLMIISQRLPVETVRCRNIKGPLWLTENYIAPAFCFNASLDCAAEHIFKLIDYFLDKSIAHNIFISRGNAFSGRDEITRVFIWPRKSSHGAKQLAAFNVAALELSGFFAVYSIEDFKNLQSKDLEQELTKWQLDDFNQLCKEVENLY